MTEDKIAKAREQGTEIKSALDRARLKMVDATYEFIKSGGANPSELEALRRKIEVMEYALTCVPPAPARIGRVVLG